MTQNVPNMYWRVNECVKIHCLPNCVCTQLCLTLYDPWTLVCQAPLFMRFSRQEYWSGWPLPSPGDLPDLEINP